MRIALLVTDLTPPRIGGISRVATSLAEKFSELGHEVDVFCLARSSEEHQNKGYHVIPVEPKWVLYKDYPVVSFSRQAFKAMLAHHVKKPYDVSHAMNFNNLGLIFQWKNMCRLGLPHVSTGFETTQMELKAKRTEFMSKPNFHNFAQIVMESMLAPWQRIYIGWADAITTEDEETRNNFIKMGLNSDKIQLIPSGIEFDELSNYQIPEEWDFPIELEGQKFFLCPGRVDPRKGSQYLVSAFAQIKNQLPNTCLIFVGGGRGSYMASMIKLTQQLGVADRVKFIGKVEDLRPYYAMADAVVIPSLSEGIPITLQEALVFQKPILCSKLQGTFAWAKDLKSIRWCEPGDVLALSKGLKSLSEGVQEASLKDSKVWMKQFDWSSVAQAYLKVFERAIASRKLKK